MSVQIITGDCRAELAKLPAESVHCCVTSPPYFGLRDYGVDGQIGLEESLEAYIETMVAVFREVRRVLRKDGTVWLNLGDSHNAAGRVGHGGTREGAKQGTNRASAAVADHVRPSSAGLKPKDLMMIPARVALALQADGWWLRSQMPWIKRNPMPDSADDRPGAATEYVFLLTKSAETQFWQHRDGGATRTKPQPDYRWIHRDTDEERTEPPPGWPEDKKWRRVNLWRGRDYFFDMEAVRSEARYPKGPNAPDKIKSPYGQGFTRNAGKQRGHGRRHAGFNDRWDAMSREEQMAKGRNFRNSDLFYASLEPPHGLISGADGPLALDVNPAGFAAAHFATFPPTLVEPCIRAGTSEKGCCAKCGAPWVRQVKTSYENPGQRTTNGPRSLKQRHETAGFSVRLEKRTETLNWSRSCDCNVEPTDPCVVLDPFGGAGTTGLVADRLGRNAVLIELNPDYAEMARRRISDDAPLFASADLIPDPCHLASE